MVCCAVVQQLRDKNGQRSLMAVGAVGFYSLILGTAIERMIPSVALHALQLIFFS